MQSVGWPWMSAIAFMCGPVHPGLTSWVILSRPRSTSSGQALRDWVVSKSLTQDLRPGLLSAVPTGLIAVDSPTYRGRRYLVGRVLLQGAESRCSVDPGFKRLC